MEVSINQTNEFGEHLSRSFLFVESVESKEGNVKLNFSQNKVGEEIFYYSDYKTIKIPVTYIWIKNATINSCKGEN